VVPESPRADGSSTKHTAITSRQADIPDEDWFLAAHQLRRQLGGFNDRVAVAYPASEVHIVDGEAE
jgi:hypothetical protein